MTRDGDRPKLCLRCDWSGDTTPGVCPNCGAPLYRPAPAGGPAARSRAPAVRSQLAPSPTIAPEPSAPALPDDFARQGPDEEDRRDRSRRAVAAVLVGLLVLASAVWVVQRERAERSAAGAPRLTGTLIYTVDDGPGWARLWQVSLETGRARPGARVRDPTALVNASGAAPGLMGITSETPDGRFTGSLLRFFGPSDSPVPLVRGDLVSWGGRGIAVVAVKRGPIEAGCRHIAIVTRTVIPPTSERQFSERVCGDILSVGRDSTSTYFTLWRGDRADILLAGYGRTHLILPDHALLSLSPASDMLVVPSRALAAVPLAPLAVRVADGPPVSSVFGSALYFRGISKPRAYGGPQAHLWIDKVLTWANDSTSALVVGRFQDRTGLYEIDAGPSRLLPPPTYLGPVQGVMWASYADDGTAFVSSSDGIAVVHDGAMSPLPLPANAPAADGPVVWLP